MIIRRALTTALVFLACAHPAVARAEGTNACRDGYDRSQVLRDSGKLVESRKLLRQCASASCSAFVQKECVGWLEDVETRLASVIFSAKDGAGADLVDVTVSMDGAEVTRKLEGHALDVDPGDHTFLFETADGRKVEQHVLLREREKAKTIAVTIGAPEAAVVASNKPLAPPAMTTPPPEPRDAQGQRPLRLVGFVAAGVGVVGLVVGAIFGLKASSDLAAPHCDQTSKLCDPGTVSEAKQAATVSSIGFVAGGVLVASGITLVLLPPSGGSASNAGAPPSVGLNGTGLSLRGVW